MLAEVRLSDETIRRVCREGQQACTEAATRIAGMFEPLIWQATRKLVDISLGTRPKRRRSRVGVLAGIEQANAMRRAARERRRIE